MKIKNLKRLQRKLRRMSPVAKEEIRKALAESAAEIVALQKQIVPAASGDLRDSIEWRYGDAKKIRYSQSFKGASGGHELSVRISAGNEKVRYAHLVEFGAAPHIAGGKFEGAQHPGAPAQPFFYPAFRLGKKRAKARIGRAVGKAARKVAAGG
ncbi:HK97-gp10 family putative phage morphogenesis protein [Mesorhizobium sp. WSM2239]|uniref:HK97-gp10 family putative phage morphogenesis protein n=2 Tax=unclassified Mesorhizobium TaxID=325217 RepID=A0AAU8D341_9HYPH